jgi:hypothetical protein
MQKQLVAIGIVFSSLFLSALCAAQSGPPVKFTKFTSREGAFSVQLPGEPIQKSEDTASGNGPTTLHTFQVEENRGESFYLVGYSDYQANLDETASLKGVIDAQVTGIKGTITADKKVALNGHPGRAVTIETGDLVFYSTVYVAGKRLYQVMYGMPKAAAISSGGKKFLDSFEILI